LDTFFHGNGYALFFLQKMGWAIFWAIFSQTHPVTLNAAAASQCLPSEEDPFLSKTVGTKKSKRKEDLRHNYVYVFADEKYPHSTITYSLFSCITCSQSHE
jgi:hypothetical protein